MRTPFLIVLFACLASAVLSGCSTTGYFDDPRFVRGPDNPPMPASAGNARALPMFRGSTGAAMGWGDVLRACDWADVIIVGEQHDDALGHAVQTALVEDVFPRWTGSALTMEMLERDEQPIVDDYLDGIIDAETFATLTHSENWGDEGMWYEWYQPSVDAARNAGAQVVAANAPRRYVKLARSQGYDALAALPKERRRMVNWPEEIPEGPYKDRFFGLMSDMHRPTPPPAPEVPDEMPVGMPSADAPPAEKPAQMPPRRMSMPSGNKMAESLFRSQLVWDTTMATSIANARQRGARKVIHFVGQFHCDFEGGTVAHLRKLRPEDRILVISMQRAEPRRMLEEDRDRADIIIYTGER